MLRKSIALLLIAAAVIIGDPLFLLSQVFHPLPAAFSTFASLLKYNDAVKSKVPVIPTLFETARVPVTLAPEDVAVITGAPLTQR